MRSIDVNGESAPVSKFFSICFAPEGTPQGNGTVESGISATEKPLPPDPEEKNDDRASWAQTAVNAFQRVCGTDDEDAVADLLCNLMHLCDRNGQDFEANLRRARMNYEGETTDPDAQEAPVPEGMTRFYVRQERDAVQHYSASVIAKDAAEALAKAEDDKIEGEWQDDGVSTLDDREIRLADPDELPN